MIPAELDECPAAHWLYRPSGAIRVMRWLNPNRYVHSALGAGPAALWPFCAATRKANASGERAIGREGARLDEFHTAILCVPSAARV